MAENKAQGEWALPDGWAQATIGEIAERINSGFPSGKHNTEGIGVPHLRPMNISPNGEIDLSLVKYVEVSDYDALQEGDVLFNNTNSPVWLGKTAYIKKDTNWAYSNHMTRVRLQPEFDSGWVAYALHHLFLIGFFRMNCRHHVNQASINTNFLSTQTAIPIPPLAEQHHIVAEIETQFTRLDAAVAALEHVQANLRRYKAAVLQAACEGRLVPTEAELARVGAHRDAPLPYEPADQLLARILAERRARWEAEHPGKRYNEPALPDVEDLPELPEGWVWASVEQVSDRIVDCLHSTPKFQESGFLCVDTNCIKPGRIVLEKARYVDGATFIERNRRMRPEEDDVLFSREGALLGIAVKVPANLDICLGQRMMVFRLGEGIEAKHYENVLNSLVFRRQYVKQITGTASPHLNIRDIRLFAISVPPAAEQHRIVAEVERRLSLVAALEASVEAALARAGRLRQAVLKQAFEGRLVPQDPDDEPASVLLERIRAERAQQGRKRSDRKAQPKQMELF